jgi:hypothetical protein
MTATEYEPEVLSTEGLRRILAHLPRGAQAGPVCDLTAHAYLSGKAAVASGTGRGFRADLRALHREVLKAKIALDPVRIDLLPMIGLFGGERAIPRFSALAKEVASDARRRVDRIWKQGRSGWQAPGRHNKMPLPRPVEKPE